MGRILMISKLMNKLLGICAAVILISVVPTAASAQAEKKLLSDAVRIISTISSDLDIKGKLKQYELGLDKLDEITQKHGATNTAIGLLTDQNIGNFNPKKIRKNYLKLVLQYQDSTCEVTPSYLCLGYVSLKTGLDQCAGATSWGQLINGTNSLLNAHKIFFSQKANPRHLNASLAAHRSCSAGKGGAGLDYFTSKLVQQLLDQKNFPLAKGLIQKMKAPNYKFMGILKLTELKQKKLKEKFIRRLVKYFDKKISRSEDALGADLAKKEFILFYLKNAEASVLKQTPPIGFSGDLKVKGNYSSEENRECRPWIQNASFEKEIQFRTAIYNYEAQSKRKKKVTLGGWFGDGINRDTINKFPWGYCKQPYHLAINLWTIILEDKGLKEADDFLRYFKSGNKTKGDVLGKYMRINVTDPSAILGSTGGGAELDGIIKRIKDPKNRSAAIVGVDRCIKRVTRAVRKYDLVRDKPLVFRRGAEMMMQSAKSMCGLDGKGDTRAPVLEIIKKYRIGDGGHYETLKRLVDLKDICSASKVLFTTLGKKSKRFGQAVNFMINSPNINPKEKYDCGDADLELMLK